MRSDRTIVAAAASITTAMGLVTALFIWPNYRDARALRAEANELRVKIDALEAHANVLEAMKSELAEAHRTIEHDLKVIPETADLASLIRRLSLEVDRQVVVDQTFTAGSPVDAFTTAVDPKAKDAKAALQAMPLTVDMEATFDSIFALIRNAETLHRLVRVTTLKITAKRDDKSNAASGNDPSSPILKASIGLEAIYGSATQDITVARQESNRQSARTTMAPQQVADAAPSAGEEP